MLSVEGVEHKDRNPYGDCFRSPDRFRGVSTADERLPTKESIYAFHRGGKAYAVPARLVEGGRAFRVGGVEIFLYRPAGADLFESTAAFVAGSATFEEKDRLWVHGAPGARFDPGRREFTGEGASGVERLDGFDTFWFNWSMIHPETEVLEAN